MKDKCVLECSEPTGQAAGCQPCPPRAYFYVDLQGCLQAGTHEVLCVDGARVVRILDVNGDPLTGCLAKEVHPQFTIATLCAE